MEIRIIETGKEENLSIIDPKTGVNWINDLMGNHGELPDYDDDTGTYLMDQESFNWWHDLVERYQTAEDRLYSMLSDRDGTAYDTLLTNYQNINVDLEDYPWAINTICDEAEIAN